MNNVSVFVKKVSCFITLLLISVLYLSIALSTWASSQGGAKKIYDSHGNAVFIEKPFLNIISLYSAHTENLCSIGAAKQLAGISRNDDYPENILKKPRFSYREDPEKFIAHNPDLVLIRPMVERSYPEFIKKLRAAGIQVISLQPTSIREMLDYWKTLGIISGHEKEASALVEKFESEIRNIRTQVARIPQNDRPKVYFEAIHKKMKTFAETSIGMFILETAGGINIAQDATRVRTTNIAFFGKEKLLSRGDEIDIFLSQYGRMNPVTIETITSEPGFKAIRAIRENRVYLIEEQLVSRPTIRILEGIDKLHSIFFKQESHSAESNQ